MSVKVEQAPAMAETTTPSRVQWSLIALELFISVTGLAGGIWMSLNAPVAMPLDLLIHTPFSDWLLPGLALTFFVGILPGCAALAQYLQMPIAKWANVGVGIGMIAWIVLEVAWIVVAPAFQITFVVIGLAVVILGIMNFQASREQGE